MGRLPLHAATLAFGDRAVMVAGDSGAGKSTLAAVLALAGGVPVADDLSAPEPGPDGHPVVAPVFPGLRLSPPAAGALGLGGDLSSPGGEDGKRRLAVDRRLPHGPRRVAAILIITGRSNDGEISPVPPGDALALVLSHLVGKSVTRHFGTMPAIWAAASALCRAVPVYALRPPEGLDGLRRYGEQVTTIACLR
ncbi:hypothetical protein WG926_24145 [Tistrella sp. BH-R2-4]|uniref:HPr kinase/phosphorylase C-terminal domain-containing protein n=1 Tax=Tistrella arctica TaxID=3133430 RepID=A0ABU9YRI6_9PROT